MSLAPSMCPRRTAFLCALVAITALLAAGSVSAQPHPRQTAAPGAAKIVEGSIVAMPADNLLVTDIKVGQLRAARIVEGEVLDVTVGASTLRARFVGRDELERLLTDRAAWASADVDVLCYETGQRTLAITAAGAPLADLVPTPGHRRVVVTKP